MFAQLFQKLALATAEGMGFPPGGYQNPKDLAFHQQRGCDK